MPRVLSVINRLNIGGPTLHVAYLIKHLPSSYESLLVSGVIDDTEGSSNYILDDLGLKPIVIPEMYREINPLRDSIALQKIKKIIKDFKPDIVHTHAAKSGALGRLAAIQCNVPVTVHTFHGHVFHSYFGALKTKAFLEIERWLAKRTSKIIAISQLQKDELSEVFKICPPEKIAVIPLGFELEKFTNNTDSKRQLFRQKYLVEENEIVISIIGRLVPVKNHYFFVETIKQLIKNTTIPIRVFIVGDGELRTDLENKVAEAGIDFTDFQLSPRKALLTFTSWIREIEEVIAGSDIIALTSLNEGTPSSLIEAQAGGKPVVSTDVGGVRDIVLPGITGFVSSPHDTTTLAVNLLQLVENKELSIKMGGNARRVTMDKYDLKRLMYDIEHLYSVLLNEAKH